MSRSQWFAPWSWKKGSRKGRRSHLKASASRAPTLTIEALECRDLLSVTLSGGFYGFGFDLSTGETPPDTQVAAGPSAVIEAVNTNLAIINKSGETFTDSFETLFSGVRVDAFDDTLLTDVSVHFDADAPGVGVSRRAASFFRFSI